MMQEPASRTITWMVPTTTVANARQAMQDRIELDWQDLTVEPSLDEIMADPIMQLVFDRDHLDAKVVKSFLKSTAHRLSAQHASVAA